MNSNFKLDIPYIAGLFDAKGTISHRNKVWKMEMSMPDRNVMELIHETLECGGSVLIEIVFLLQDYCGPMLMLNYTK